MILFFLKNGGYMQKMSRWSLVSYVKRKNFGITDIFSMIGVRAVRMMIQLFKLSMDGILLVGVRSHMEMNIEISNNSKWVHWNQEWGEKKQPEPLKS